MTPTKKHVVALSLILVIGVAPFIPVAIAGAVASANSCRLDEAGAYPCVILGHDFGGLCATMGVLGWAGLVTIPIAMGLLVLWGAATMLHLAGRRRSLKKEREP